MIASDFEATYNALQAVFHRRQQRGLTVSSSYTLAHAVTTNLAPWNTAVVERYDSDFDVRHRLVISGNYELPAFNRGGRVGPLLLRGWQVNTVAMWQTGLPFTVINATPLSNTGGADRPNQVANPVVAHPTVEQWFDPAAFAAQPVNTAGNTGRNTLHGPPQRQLDLSVFRNLRTSAQTWLQLRAEIFNVTNTPNFAVPNSNFGTPGFGSITSTGNGIPRQMQFAAKLLF
jgi:hypothetical protein